MGGYALRTITPRRLSVAEHDALLVDALARLRAQGTAGCLLCDGVPLLPEMLDHGDVDVLVAADGAVDLAKVARACFGCKEEVVCNGLITSLSWRGAQLNLIYVGDTADHLAMARFFMAYGDVGCLLGIMCKHYGLTLGQSGLDIILLDELVDEGPGGAMGTRVRLTSNPRAVCTFLGLDFERHAAGFATRAQVMEFLRSCRLYNAQVFTTLPCTERRKARLRPFFAAFLKAAAEQVGAEHGGNDEHGAAARCTGPLLKNAV